MTFQRGATTIAAKELRHLLHDPYTLVLTMGLPIFTLLLFGYALDTRVRDVPTAIEDLDKGRYSQALIDDFSHSPVFHLLDAGGAPVHEKLRSGVAKVAVQIPAGYSTAMFYGHRCGFGWMDRMPCSPGKRRRPRKPSAKSMRCRWRSKEAP